MINLGAEITYLAMEHQSSLTVTDFIVASYYSTKKGIVQKFSIADDVNEISITHNEKEVWKTDLKVVKVVWKFSNY